MRSKVAGERIKERKEKKKKKRRERNKLKERKKRLLKAERCDWIETESKQVLAAVSMNWKGRRLEQSRPFSTGSMTDRQ